ncbi:xyloglucan-specific endo-beta-1,4-glucanase A [Seiridium cupressi]
MHQSLLQLLCSAAAVAPALAVPQGFHARPGGNYGCDSRHSSVPSPIASATVVPTEVASATSAASEVETSSSVATSEVVAVPTTATSEVVAVPTSSTSEFVAVPTTASSEVVEVPTSTSSKVVAVPTTTAAPVATTVATSSSAVATSTSTPQAESTETLTSTFCGAPDSYEVLSGTPWIIYSMNYNYQSISGSCCTGYYSTSGSGDDQTVHWSSIWDIDEAVSTNVVKGYSFIGLTQNLETTLDSITSIPSTYTWGISNTTAYKGNVVYDFMTSDTKGDSTSSSAQELMLWLQYEGGQVPIGWADGAVATIDGLFGKDGWQLYQGKNTDTGITVSSLLVPEGDMFDGTFEGDIKDWLSALSEQGIFSTSTYVNVGNAGMEPYWGTVTFDNNLSLRINV